MDQTKHNMEEVEKSILTFETAVADVARSFGKQLKAEQQKIGIKKREYEIIIQETKNMKEEISKLDEMTHQTYRYFTNTKENLNSLKNSNSLLQNHEAELMKALQQEMENSEIMDAVFKESNDKFQEKWEHYYRDYEKNPLNKEINLEKRKSIELEEYVKSLESEMRQYQAEIFRLKCEKSRRNNEESEIYNFKRFIIRIAELKTETMDFNNRLKYLHGDIQDINSKLRICESINSEKEKTESRSALSINKTSQSLTLNNITFGEKKTPRSEPSTFRKVNNTEEAPKLKLFVPQFLQMNFSQSSNSRADKNYELTNKDKPLNRKNILPCSSAIGSSQKMSDYFSSNSSFSNEESSRMNTTHITQESSESNRKHPPNLNASVCVPPERETLNIGSNLYQTSEIQSKITEMNPNQYSEEQNKSSHKRTRIFSPLEPAYSNLAKRQCANEFFTSPNSSTEVMSPFYQNETPDRLSMENTAINISTQMESSQVEKRDIHPQSPFDFEKHYMMLESIKKSPDFALFNKEMFNVKEKTNLKENIYHDSINVENIANQELDDSSKSPLGEPVSNNLQISKTFSTSLDEFSPLHCTSFSKAEFGDAEKSALSYDTSKNSPASPFNFGMISQKPSTSNNVFDIFGCPDASTATSPTRSGSPFQFSYNAAKESTSSNNSALKFLF